MSKTIGIFQGKQAKHNKDIIKYLYEYGPFTAWGLTGKLQSPFSKDESYRTKPGLHATLNKRLRDLEKKGYVLKSGKLWAPNFKGYIAYLILEPEPKTPSEKLHGTDFVKDRVNLARLASIAKKLIEEGVINFDVIKNKTLGTLLIAEDKHDWLDKILEKRS